MIKELMDKLHTSENENGNPAVSSAVEAPKVQAPLAVPNVPPVPRPTIPPVPKPVVENQNLGGGFTLSTIQNNNNNKLGGIPMNAEGIIIDLGEGISLNVPIKKRMTLHDFLRVAEKVKALEMLAEEEAYKRSY